MSRLYTLLCTLVCTAYLFAASTPQTTTTEWSGTLTEAKYYTDSQDWVFFVDMTGYRLQLTLVTGQKTTLDGNYTTSDFSLDYCAYLNMTTGMSELTFTDINMTITAPDGARGTIDLDATLIGKDGNTYHLTAHRDPMPIPTKVIEINIDDLEVSIEDMFGMMMLTTVTAADDSYSIRVPIMGEGDGIYTTTDLMGYITIYDYAVNQELSLTLLDADMTLSDKGCLFEANLLTDEAICYQLHFQKDRPAQPDKTIEVTYTNPANLYFEEGAFMFDTEEEVFPEISEQYPFYTSLAIKSNEVIGEYTYEDFDLYHTELLLIDPEKQAPIQNIGLYDAKANITEKDNVYYCQAEFWGKDNVLYKVNLTAPKPKEGTLAADEKTDPVNRIYNAEDDFSMEYSETMNAVRLMIQSNEQQDNVGLIFYIDTQDPVITIPVGTYAIDASEKPGTVLASTGINEDNKATYSLYGKINENGLYTNVWFFVSGTVVIENKEGALHMVVDARNSYDLPIHIEYTGAPTDLDQTEDHTTRAQKFLTPDGQIYILRNGHTYTIAGQCIQ